MSDEGRLIAGRYRVLSRIGSGAMGAVWMAQDELLHRTVAIKQLLLQSGLEEHEIDDARARTMREARIAARLHHPNAISVFDVVTDDSGQPCLVMEYLESTSLAQELQGGRTLAPTDVAQIGAQVSAALKAAHAVGIVHRDIKPGNILLAPNGMVKLTDFGISRAKDDVTVTKTGMIAGTPAYLAPEVAIGGDPGPESDIFSLGSTLYAATEGQPPFGLSENTLSLLHAVAAGQINPPRQSGPLTSVLAVMLHPETQHRPTAEECEELLEAVSHGETPLGGPADEQDDADRTSVLGTAGAAAAGGAIGGALGAGVAGAAGAGEDLPAGHSGTLGSGAGGHYDDHGGYDDYAAAGGYPVHDYPEHDYDDPAYPATAYDSYGDYDERTRVAAAAGYGAYPDDPYDHDPYDDPDGTRVAAAGGGAGVAGAGAVDEDDEKPKWKVPALVGGLVVVGLAAFAVWLFSGPSGDDPEPAGNPAPATTSTSQPTSSSEPTTSSPEPTTEEPTYVEPEPTYEEPEPTYEEPTSSYVEPEPTTEPSPEPPPSSEEPPPTSSDTPGPSDTNTTTMVP
ncbi:MULTISPECIES: serine/threonine-protein kinase [Prauserella salsuginis group]|uniref:non-specific serine/threonine protein kinase n=1 Tax=Prauserella salsuginis TaxID=387889 RepID=A0ABW6G2Q5_9PSEU|nr:MULTISPECIES: serine/threonine-protein kinase [Prauserella salsuginis group]MCR3719747.1 Serine/threonine protein kinase [Prauserella flava]MCR3736710.1 Serine/threonine protein kinase [Prauserella salsuginis]